MPVVLSLSSWLPKIFAEAPAFQDWLLDENTQFRVVGYRGGLGIPFDASVETLCQDTKENNLGEIRGVAKVRSWFWSRPFDRAQPFAKRPSRDPRDALNGGI